jgi:hypothetical protein
MGVLVNGTLPVKRTETRRDPSLQMVAIHIGIDNTSSGHMNCGRVCFLLRVRCDSGEGWEVSGGTVCISAMRTM